MSDMLEQAIIDADALKEAATKNAETLVLEKYSSQIKEAVETLLEQEELAPPAAEADPLADPMAAADDVPEATEQPSVMEHIPLAAMSEDDDQVEIPLDQLLEEVSNLTQALRFNGDVVGDPELYEHNLVDFDDDVLMEEGLSEEDLYEVEEDLYSEDYGAESNEGDFLEEDLYSEEEPAIVTDLSEDYSLEEQLTVDLAGPNKSGWAGMPEGELRLAEEELLALEQDSKIREEKAALRKAVEDLKAVNESAEKRNTKLTKALNKSTKFVTKLRDAVVLLEKKLDEASMANAKLLYQNKALDSDSLNERQKQKLVEAVSNAETIEEAKVIFETLQNTVGSTSRKTQPNSLSEAVQKSSSVILSARKNNPERQTSNPTLNRWKFLAGIDKQ